MIRLLLILLLVPGLAASQTMPARDHGMVLATAMDVAPGKLKDTTDLADTKNYVFRGKLITLNAQRDMHLCFDTEHLRIAGAWRGKYPQYASFKDMGPPVVGTMLFTTRPGPGWAKAGKWDDPRPSKEGPLPADWARYRGLYVHGDKVILSYTVGSTRILECIRAEGDVVVRTLNIDAGDTPLEMLVCEEPGAEGNTASPDGRHAAILQGKEERVLATAPDAPIGTTLKVMGARLHLHVPVRSSPVRFNVCVTRQKLDTATTLRTPQAAAEDLEPLTKGGPSHWPQTLTTRGELGSEDKGPYALDNIALPEMNPWGASIRFGGLDFFDDGRAALCTWDGDVWIVSGLDDKLDKVTWKRFAAGLQQPLGLRVIKGVVHTAGRDQITRLHDLNGDGEADFYENLNNDSGLTLQRHEFVMDLQTDADGNLYYCRSGHYISSKRGDNCAIYKMSPDGKNLQRIASGFREPNGMVILPDGTMLTSDNEGNGVPQTPLYRLKEGMHYGYTPGTSMKGGTWKPAQTPIVWLPLHVDRSAGGPVYVSSDKWGPLKGRVLFTSYGNCTLYSLLIDKHSEPWQGAVWKFPFGFTSGVMRARFHPSDGQLYVCGLRGWSTNAVKDGQFARVRYTGKDLPIPVGFHVTKSGLAVAFSQPLDRKSAEDDQNWAGDWTGKVAFEGKAKEKRIEMPIEAASLSADGTMVELTLEKVLPVTNFTLKYRLKSAAGPITQGELHGTIHRVPDQ